MSPADTDPSGADLFPPSATERTALSWRRTALAAAALAAAGLKAAVSHHEAWSVVSASFAGLAAVILYGVGRSQSQQLAGRYRVIGLAALACLLAAVSTAVAVGVAT